MLVLSRRPDESIIISDNVVVTILGINERQVKVGITAPKNIAVNREEIYQKILAKKLAEEEKK